MSKLVRWAASVVVALVVSLAVVPVAAVADELPPGCTPANPSCWPPPPEVPSLEKCMQTAAWLSTSVDRLHSEVVQLTWERDQARSELVEARRDLVRVTGERDEAYNRWSLWQDRAVAKDIRLIRKDRLIARLRAKLAAQR